MEASFATRRRPSHQVLRPQLAEHTESTGATKQGGRNGIQSFESRIQQLNCHDYKALMDARRRTGHVSGQE
ncbi:MAG: hypothetical protein KGH72_04600 [Candidatus Micrarchaeota archaeon]|nr:hypothetical protein [Candidatus Micrarchaeota archaeon]